MLPADLRDSIEGVGLIAGPGADDALDLAPIREAMRAEYRLAFDYADAKGANTRRTVGTADIPGCRAGNDRHFVAKSPHRVLLDRQ